jgi:hypothetical protein
MDDALVHELAFRGCIEIEIHLLRCRITSGRLRERSECAIVNTSVWMRATAGEKTENMRARIASRRRACLCCSPQQAENSTRHRPRRAKRSKRLPAKSIRARYRQHERVDGGDGG